MNKSNYPMLSKMPYYGTKVSADNSRMQILSLLGKYGIKDQMWGTLEGKEAIQFKIDTVSQGVQLKKMVRVDIPILKAYKGGRVVEVPRAQTLRFVYWTLKQILEATEYSIFKLEHILMSYILTQLPDGKVVQIKDLIENNPQFLLSGGNSFE